MIQKKSLKEAIQNPEIISVVEGLLPEVILTKKGVVGKNTLESKSLPVGNNDILYQLTNNGDTIGHTISALIIGYCTKAFILTINSTIKDYSDLEIKKISGNVSSLEFYCDGTAIYFKKKSSVTGICSLTLITNNAGPYFKPLFTPALSNNTEGMNLLKIS